MIYYFLLLFLENCAGLKLCNFKLCKQAVSNK